MKAAYRKIIEKWEAASGFEAMQKETVKSKATLLECLRMNQKWLEDHQTETFRRASAVIARLG